MYEAYRVRKGFDWSGWAYGVQGGCDCGCASQPGSASQCAGLDGTGRHGTGCLPCLSASCHCQCAVHEDRWAGDVWIVNAGHPRKEMMLSHRFVVGDGGLLNVDELLKLPGYERLMRSPVETKPGPERWVKPAGRRRVAAR